MQELFRFNEVISNLRLEELLLQGHKFTWTNKQESALLERLDWFFASVPWFTNYPSSVVSTLFRDISDHHPCLVSMSTDITESKVFRFENYWLLHDEFMLVMQHGWNLAVMPEDRATKLVAKFKKLRRVLRC
jgi:hypothetical protein